MKKITAEIADNYVRYGIESKNFTRKKCFSFVIIFIVLGAVAILLYNKIPMICVASACIALDVVVSLICYLKWSATSLLVLQAAHLLAFAVITDAIYFAMYQAAGLFVLQDFIVAMSLQAAFVLPISAFTVFHAATFKETFNEKKSSALYKICGVVGGTAYAVTSVLCKIFLTDVSASVVLSILSVLMNILVYLLIFVIVNVIYRIYLLKKFNLSFDVQ